MKFKILVVFVLLFLILPMISEIYASVIPVMPFESAMQFDDDAADANAADNPFSDSDDDEDNKTDDNPFSDAEKDGDDNNDNPFASGDDDNPFDSTLKDDKSDDESNSFEDNSDKTDDDESVQVYQKLTAADIEQMLGLDRFVWRGYFENQLSGSELQRRFYLQDYNKMRLELVTSTKESDADEIYADLNIALIGQTFHGKTSVQALDYIPEKFANLIVPADRDSYLFTFADDFRLEVGEVVLNSGRLQLRLGKIMLKSGTGYFFNPTDVFMLKNPSDPSYETPGIPAISAEYFLEYDPPASVGAMLAFDETFRYSTKLIYFKYFFRFGDELTADAKIQFASRNENYVEDYQTFDEKLQTLDQLGFDVHFNLLGLGLGFEIAYNICDVRDDWLVALAQVDYTFSNGIFFLMEYYYDESGNSKVDDYNLNDWLAYIFGAKLTLGQHYVTFAAQYEASLLFSFSLSGFINLSDNSAAIIPRVDWKIMDGVQLNIYALVPVGADETEFGTQSAQFVLRFRYSFTSN